jgi:parallel beta-helix repeat protein
VLAAGTYEITDPLSLSVDHVTLRGAGLDQTILNLAGLTGSGEGLLVQANDFTIEDLAFEDAPGDQFKVLGADGLRIRRVRAEWTNGPDENNGAYGLYPVDCKDVLIEDSVVKGASDAGIYTGQSRNIIVRRNRVEQNVAGIEIENSTGADVYENIATGNTGGILVFNLPGLPVYGARTRVFDNEVFENNTDNFAPEGNIVAGVPKGTGVLVLANDQVEITGNAFRDNDSSHITLISFNTARLLSGLPEPTDPRFDAFSESLYVHDNTYEGGGTAPPSSLDALVAVLGGLPIPHIVFDGDVDPGKLENGMLPNALRTCVQEAAETTFVNLDIGNTFANLSRDPAPFNCSHPGLTPIAMAGVQ